MILGMTYVPFAILLIKVNAAIDVYAICMAHYIIFIARLLEREQFGGLMIMKMEAITSRGLPKAFVHISYMSLASLLCCRAISWV